MKTNKPVMEQLKFKLQPSSTTQVRRVLRNPKYGKLEATVAYVKQEAFWIGHHFILPSN